MTYAMEIHDSRLEELVCNPDGTGHALFHAVIFRSEGRVFHDAQESGWQKLRFDFQGMRVEGEAGELAIHGKLRSDGAEQNHVILLPADHEGKICLEMRFFSAKDRALRIYATSIRSNFIGEFEIEGHWDASGNYTR